MERSPEMVGQIILHSEVNKTGNAEEHVEQGLLLYAQGLKREALERYRRAVNMDPDNAMAHYLMGITMQALGRGAAARSEWETVLYLQERTDKCAWAKKMARKLLEEDTPPTPVATQQHVEARDRGV
jgi:tetratricopeptide (TPR) repeat protein